MLGIESSCDETAAAVFEPRWREQGLEHGVLSDCIASQVALHAPHGGIVPELASRQHLRDIQGVHLVRIHVARHHQHVVLDQPLVQSILVCLQMFLHMTRNLQYGLIQNLIIST